MSEIIKHDGSRATWEADTTAVPLVTGNTEVGFYAGPREVWNTQVGGNHYAKYPIQPTEYIIKNNLPFCEGNVVKYVTRWKDKGGIEDLRKARHYIDMLISEVENGGN